MVRNSLNLLNFIKALPLFLMLGIALAQTAEEIINTIIAVGIIVAVVIALLYLGEVWKPGKATFRIPWGLIIYIILIIVIFVLPLLQRLGMIKIFPDTLDEAFKANPDFYETYQKSFMMQRLPAPICNVFKYLAVDERIACYMPAFLYFFLLPFVAIYAITWGFLTQIKIFGDNDTKRLNPLLAFIIAFMTLPMGIFLIMLAFWFSVLGGFSIAIFVTMFLAGVFFRGFGFTTEAYIEGTKRYFNLRYKGKAETLIRELSDIKTNLGTFKDWGELDDRIRQLIRSYSDFTHILLPIVEGIKPQEPINKEDAEKRINEALKKLSSLLESNK